MGVWGSTLRVLTAGGHRELAGHKSPADIQSV